MRSENSMITDKEVRALNRADLPYNPTIFDIGCNLGDYTGEILKRYPEALIYAFEPIPEVCLEAYRRYGGEKVIFSSLALSSTDNMGSLYRIKSDNPSAVGCSSVVLRPVFGERNWDYDVIPIQEITIDDFMKKNFIRYVDWVKIDVEGVEADVLMGASSALSHHAIGKIQFEYSDTFRDAGYSMKDILNIAEQFDYALCDLLGDEFVEMKNFVDDWQFNNYYLIRRDLLWR